MLYSIHIYSYCKIVTWEYMQYNILYLVNKNHGLLKSMSSCQAICIAEKQPLVEPFFDKNVLATWLFGSGYSKRHRIQNTHVYLTPIKASKSKSRCVRPIWLLLGVFLLIYICDQKASMETTWEQSVTVTSQLLADGSCIYDVTIG